MVQAAPYRLLSLDSFSTLAALSLPTACSDKLRQNDPGFVELSLERMGENFDLEEFVFAIRANHTVKHVCFSGTFVRELQEEQWRTMLEAIGHLDTLEELQIWCATIPVDVLSQMVMTASRLRKVYFFRVGLAGINEDFQDLARVVRNHPSLRDLRIGGLHLVESTEPISLDCVIEALAETPRLEVVSLQLQGTQQPVPFSAAALGKLFESKTIQDLYLSRLGLGADHFAMIAKAIEVNDNCLRTLDLFGNSIKNDSIMLMANGLKKNTSLETLVLPCPQSDLSVESCAAISAALSENKTLVTLNLPRSYLCDDGLFHIAQGLTLNKSLKKLEVGISNNLGNKGMEALTEMLEKNYDLERLLLDSAEKSIKEKVDHFMHLNEVGRGKLLSNGKSTRQQWVEMLISCSDDLDCLFYFTTMNPALCQFANPSRAAVIITEEFRPSRRHTIDYVSEQPSRRTENRRASAF
jgi:hypothetical protein